MIVCNQYSLYASEKRDAQIPMDYIIDIHDQDELSIMPYNARLAKNDFLPNEYAILHMKKMSTSQANAILTYLSTFKEANSKRSPFTKDEQQIFDDVKDVECSTKQWLTKGQAIIIGTALAPLIGFLALSPNISGTEAIIAISLATTVAGGVNAGLAFYATGTLPDSASIKANNRQNKFAELQKNYERLAHVWVDMHFSDIPEMKEHTFDLARSIDGAFKPLQVIFKEKIGYDHGDAILCPIKEVNHYILTKKKLGISPLLKTYITIKEKMNNS